MNRRDLVSSLISTLSTMPKRKSRSLSEPLTGCPERVSMLGKALQRTDACSAFDWTPLDLASPAKPEKFSAISTGV